MALNVAIAAHNEKSPPKKKENPPSEPGDTLDLFSLREVP